MIERSQDLRFALEAREPLGIEGEAVGQDLERDVALERRVAGAIHLAHAACAKRGQNLVWAESIAGGEGHCSVSGSSEADYRATDYTEQHGSRL